MSFQTIFGSCFPISEEPDHMDQGKERTTPTPRRKSHMRNLSEMLRLSSDSTENSPSSNTQLPSSVLESDAVTPLQRPKPVRSYTSPAANRDAQRGNFPYGPTLIVHDAFLANELLGSTSSLANGQYALQDGAFIRRPSSRFSEHTRRASLPGDLRARASPSPIHMHNRAAHSLGNLNLHPTMTPFLMPPSPVHRPTSPCVTSIDTRMETMSVSTVATSFDTESTQTATNTTASTPVDANETVQDERDSLPQPCPSLECKETLDRIKAAMDEKASLERRLQELEKLIDGKTAQRSANASRSVLMVERPGMTALPQRSQSVRTPEPRIREAHPQESRPRGFSTPTPTIDSVQTITEIHTDESEAPSTPTAQPRSSESTHGTSFELDTDSQESFRMPTPTPQPQRHRPQLQLQTSLPFPPPPPFSESNERPTPSSASRITSAVSRIANWLFGEEDASTSYPRSPLHLASPSISHRPQHSSCQQFQFIQAHHLQLTPTTPQRRRAAHLSAPMGVAPASAPMVGYQQRWRPRNVEDVDPVPPYYEQDPNPSPGFVFFPQNSLLTPLPTPTSPTGVSIATQMYAHAI